MRTPRPALSTSAWRKLRARVKRVGLCFYCGTSVGPFEADHIIPPALGGGELDPANVVCACLPCNRSKASKSPDEWEAARLPAPRSVFDLRRAPYRRRGLFGDYTRKEPR